MAEENGEQITMDDQQDLEEHQEGQEPMEEQAPLDEPEAAGDQPAEAEAEAEGGVTEGDKPAEGGDAPSGSEDDKSDDDGKKIFVGGLSWDTTQAQLKEYFEKFSAVAECNLKEDGTGKSRGFGFVTFAETEGVAKVLAEKEHKLGGRIIDPKHAHPRQQFKKIFVGGLDTDLDEKEVRSFFEQFGEIEELELPFDKARNQRRAFAFITFKVEDSVTKAIETPRRKLGKKECDIKKAVPNNAMRFQRGGFRGGPRGGRGGSWGGGPPGSYGGYGQYSGYGGYGNYDQYGQYSGYNNYGNYGNYSGYSGGWDQQQSYGGGYGGYGGGYDQTGYWSGYDQQGSSGYGKSQRGGRGSYHPYSR